MSVVVSIEGRESPGATGRTLFRCATEAGVRVPTSCFEQGKCRECLVEVEEGAGLLSPRTAEEEHLDGRFRLSCRTRVVGPAGRVVCRTMRRGALEILEGASVDDDGALDPAVTRQGGRVVRGGETLAESAEAVLGVAVDVGTTSVVARLVDLETGAALATQSFENPQRFGGSDVMARIRYDSEHGGRLLQRPLLGYLGHAIEAFPCSPESIFEIVVAGNTTMRDLFFGLDVEPIGVRPYRSTTEVEARAGKRATTSLEASARKLRLPAHPAARVYGLPVVSGHVGADAAAGLLATGIAERDEVSVFMDIGTNTELFVGSRERILAASCPAGPAFEGGGVSCGMPALAGAVERVHVTDAGGVECAVIGGGRPLGICGSGLVDLLSELLRTGRMNAQGRLDDELEGRFVLDRSAGLVLTEPDVNELAQAKGANVAGLRLLLSAYGVDLADVRRVHLAGGFARHLDLGAARRIGLVPSLPDERFRKAGNTSLEGAARVLRSATRRRELESMVARVEHVELETRPDFFDAFVDGCQLVPFGSAS